MHDYKFNMQLVAYIQWQHNLLYTWWNIELEHKVVLGMNYAFITTISVNLHDSSHPVTTCQAYWEHTQLHSFCLAKE